MECHPSFSIISIIVLVLFNISSWIKLSEALPDVGSKINLGHQHHHTYNGNKDSHSDSKSSVELLTWGKDSFSFQKEIRNKGRKDIYLSAYAPQNSVVVLIVNDVPWTKSELRNMSGEFTVHAPHGYNGVMAVVQVIYLRTKKGNECVDYIQFYDPLGAIGSPRICGKLGNKEDRKYAPEELIGPRVFFGTSGMIQVQYKSDKGDPTDPDKDQDGDRSFHMVEIVFTAFKDCPGGEQASNGGPYSRCGGKCISSTVYCDERINCGFEEDFAIDEDVNICGSGGISQGQEYAHDVGAFLLNVALGSVLFILILGAVGSYHQYKAYRRIKNIPHP